MSQRKEDLKKAAIEKTFDEWKTNFFKDSPDSTDSMEFLNEDAQTTGSKLWIMTVSEKLTSFVKTGLDEFVKQMWFLAEILLPKNIFDKLKEFVKISENSKVQDQGEQGWLDWMKQKWESLKSLISDYQQAIIVFIVGAIQSKYKTLTNFLFNDPKTPKIITLIATTMRKFLCQVLSVSLAVGGEKGIFESPEKISKVVSTNLILLVSNFFKSDAFETAWQYIWQVLTTSFDFISELTGFGLGFIKDVINENAQKIMVGLIGSILKTSTYQTIMKSVIEFSKGDKMLMVFGPDSIKSCIKAPSFYQKPITQLMKSVNPLLDYIQETSNPIDVDKKIEELGEKIRKVAESNF